MLDPPLTALGEQQAAELREHLKAHLPADRKVSLILVSPMRRALQTCLIALDWLIDAGVPVVPDARWQGASIPRTPPVVSCPHPNLLNNQTKQSQPLITYQPD